MLIDEQLTAVTLVLIPTAWIAWRWLASTKDYRALCAYAAQILADARDEQTRATLEKVVRLVLRDARNDFLPLKVFWFVLTKRYIATEEDFQRLVRQIPEDIREEVIRLSMGAFITNLKLSPVLWMVTSLFILPLVSIRRALQMGETMVLRLTTV